MKFVVTLMVRDEADVIAAMIEHHIAQGAAKIIVTDNGSIDGTTEILQEYADDGFVELHHDPIHRKQQRSLVTSMARRAFTVYGADWVVNADADEFFVPVDRSMTLQQAFESIPLEIGAFTAPVFNMVGAGAQSGSGVHRLLWRDNRPLDELRGLGIFAHPTANAIHRGDADVVVQQGNHFVSIPSAGSPPQEAAIEVYHLPWRSWSQIERKTVNTGTSYDDNPDMNPSPNHHVMTDWRRYKGGRLRCMYLLRLPVSDDLAIAEASGSMIRDTWLSEHLQRLVGTAKRPDRLAAAISADADAVVGAQEHRREADIARLVRQVELERDEAAVEARKHHETATRIARERDAARAELAEARAQIERPGLVLRRDLLRVRGKVIGGVRRLRAAVDRARGTTRPR